MPTIRTFTVLAGLCLALFSVQGCGFHMRGSADIPSSLKVMSIDGIDRYSPFGRQLREALTNNGVQVVDGGRSGAVLRVQEFERNQRSLSTSASTGKTLEYELYLKVTFDVMGENGNVLVPQQKVSLVRDYTFDRSQLRGKEGERTTIENEMDRDAVQQILRRLQTAG